MMKPAAKSNSKIGDCHSIMFHLIRRVSTETVFHCRQQLVSVCQKHTHPPTSACYSSKSLRLMQSIRTGAEYFHPNFAHFFAFDPKLSIKQECPSNVFYCTKCECVCALLRACVIYVHMWIFCHRFRSVFIGVAGVKCAILAVLRYENVLAKPKQMHQQQQQQRQM